MKKHLLVAISVLMLSAMACSFGAAPRPGYYVPQDGPTPAPSWLCYDAQSQTQYESSVPCPDDSGGAQPANPVYYACNQQEALSAISQLERIAYSAVEASNYDDLQSVYQYESQARAVSVAAVGCDAAYVYQNTIVTLIQLLIAMEENPDDQAIFDELNRFIQEVQPAAISDLAVNAGLDPATLQPLDTASQPQTGGSQPGGSQSSGGQTSSGQTGSGHQSGACVDDEINIMNNWSNIHTEFEDWWVQFAIDRATWQAVQMYDTNTAYGYWTATLDEEEADFVSWRQNAQGLCSPVSGQAYEAMYNLGNTWSDHARNYIAGYTEMMITQDIENANAQWLQACRAFQEATHRHLTFTDTVNDIIECPDWLEGFR